MMNGTRLLFRVLLGRRLPRYEGTLRVEGISAPVRIRRDNWGIPYIEAQDDCDAWYGLGFCQGQDRAFQIETRLRVVRGTLAELIGEAGEPIDRLSRTLGLYRSAQEQLKALDPHVRRMLESFAQGVTAGATRGSRRPAHEFALLRARPTPYTAADILGLLKLLSFLLASNWDAELARLKVARADGSDALAVIDPVLAGSREAEAVASVAAPTEAISLVGQDLQLFLAAIGRSGGSNNWVLSPERTRSGRPIVANDPHLTPDLPPHWYLAHISTPEWRVAGAALAGAPGIIVGHNGHVAWGVTAGLTDNTDLFLEELGPDRVSVRRDGAFVPCKVREEEIRVRGKGVRRIRVLESDLGPVFTHPAATGWALSLKAVWLEPLPVVGFLGAHRAKTGEELRRLFEAWPSLPLNLVYADTGGSIGWQLVGRAPIRKKGSGLVPLPAWEPGVGWDEEGVPFDAMPHRVNPPEGFLATANSAPQEGDGPYLGSDWLEPYRKQRIVERLAAKGDWTVEENCRLQLDVKSLPWRALKPILLALEPADPDAKIALELLRAWDGNLDADSPAATVFEGFLFALARRVLSRKAPNSADVALGQGSVPLAPLTSFGARVTSRVIRWLVQRPPGWFERGWEHEIEQCLAGVVRELRRDVGDSPERWGWGKVRPLVLTHPAARGPLARVFNRGPFPIGGDTNTIAQAGVHPLNWRASPLAIASLRAVIEVGSWDKARFVLPGGQSGNPLSPHYDDMLALWLKGESLSLAWSDQRIAQVAVKILTLLPNSRA